MHDLPKEPLPVQPLCAPLQLVYSAGRKQENRVHRLQIALVLSCLGLACTPDPLPTVDAGPPPTLCPGGTEALTGRCLEGLGAQVACPTSAFSSDHSWTQDSANLRFVAQDGSGDGSSESAPAGSIEAALTGAGDDVIVLLGQGSFEMPAQRPITLTLIGRCAGESTLSLGAHGPISLNTDESLRLWGLSLGANGALQAGQALVAMVGEAVLEAHQNRFSGGGDGLQVQGQVTLNQNTFAALSGRAINATGQLSGVIIGDNHFLGPLGGDGVFLGPLGGDGVFSIMDNTFAEMVGSGLIVTDSRSGVIIGDNHFLGPLGGDGVFVGPAEGGVAISNNQFGTVAGDALVLQEVSGNAQVTGNTISAPTPGTGGAGIVLLDLVGGIATVTDNTISGATSMALVVERVGSQVELTGNVIEGTIPPVDTGGNHQQTAYGVAIMDSKAVQLTNNTIRNNSLAGIVYDQGNWGRFLRRQELSGACEMVLEGNNFSGNNENDVIIQNHSDDQTTSGQPQHQTTRGDDSLMPMTSRQGRGSCGDGRISGAEECDPQDVDSQFLCAENCRVRRDQRSASGRGFSCFIDSTHRVVCVGQQINPVFTPGRRDAVPYQIVGPTLIQTLDQAIVAVAAGGRHICALTLAGTVLCWGDQTKAQTGRCEQANRMLGTPETVKRVEGIELTRVSGISAYGDTTCAWTHEGELYCWGESTFGQTGSREPIVTCATRVGDEGFKARKAAVGDNFTCVLTPNNKVRCFGLNDALQLGVSTNNTCRDGQFSYPCSREPLGAVEIQANTPLIATQLSAGSGACAIAENAELFCWGPHPHYNGGIPITQDAHLSNDDGHGAAKVMGLVGATKVGLGELHGCVLDQDHKLQCWSVFGYMWSGEDDHLSSYEPDDVLVESQPVYAPLELTVGETHTCMLRSNRKVSCWGDWPEADGTPQTEQLMLEFEVQLP